MWRTVDQHQCYADLYLVPSRACVATSLHFYADGGECSHLIHVPSSTCEVSSHPDVGSIPIFSIPAPHTSTSLLYAASHREQAAARCGWRRLPCVEPDHRHTRRLPPQRVCVTNSSDGPKVRDVPGVSVVLRLTRRGCGESYESNTCLSAVRQDHSGRRLVLHRCGASLTAAVTSPTMGLEGAACPTCSTHNPEHAGFVPCVGSDSLPSLCHVHSRLEQDDYGNVTDRSR